MLREMGLRLWLPAATAAEPLVVAAAAAVAVTAPPAPVAPERVTPAAPAAPASPATPAAVQPPLRAARPAAPPPSPQPLTRAPADPALLAMDWPALRSAVEACRACSLCETRQQTVFGVGHPRAQWMIVGEAPGEQEDALGEPFVGESGQLLDRMLSALGLSRDAAEPADPARQVYITNALKCRPPRNRNPTAAERASCQPFLERQVALVQPRVILAMGRFAVQSLLGSDEPIGKLRGRLHDWRGVPLVVTYHPAYLLRQPADKAKAWDDLCLAAACMDPPPG